MSDCETVAPSLIDLFKIWIEDYPGWYIHTNQLGGKWSLIYKDDYFSSIAALIWDDKVICPRKHLDIPITDMTMYDYQAADPEFFPKIRKDMLDIEATFVER